MELMLQGIQQRVGAEVHLHQLDLQLVPRAVTVLLGATQAGKTTLLRIMAGLDKPTGGRVKVDGTDVTGVPVRMEADNVNAYFDVQNPYKGKSESIVDLWIGYDWKFNKNVRWRTQLNVRNVFAKDELIPVTVQPDGSPAGFRIPEPRTITLTNTIEF